VAGDQKGEPQAVAGVDNHERGIRRYRTRRSIVKRFLGPVLAMTLMLSSVGGILAAKDSKEATVVCPVLKQKVAKSKAIKVVHNGKTYYVCCDSCAEQIRSGKFK
jgi:YHS domain-containing protein